MTDDPRALAARLLAQSRYVMPRAEALAHIEARRRQLLAPLVAPAPPAPLILPEPMPVLDDPEQHARKFWQAKAKLKPPAKKTKHRGLSVIDGGKGAGETPEVDG